jgi:hypothetical protein
MNEPNAPTYIKEVEEEDVDLSGLSIKLIIENNNKAKQ